jgi:transcriptional adapter 3
MLFIFQWLEDLVKSYSPNQKLYEVPPLGEHYAKNWAKEELEMQKSQSSCSPRPISKKLKLAERVSPEVVELVNRANAAA